MKRNREEDIRPEPEPDSRSLLSITKLLSLEETNGERERGGGGGFRDLGVSML